MHSRNAMCPRSLITAFILTTTLMLEAGIFPASVYAAPSWDDVPQQLRHQSGVQQQADYFFATGMAEEEVIAGRADKAYELARKKSLARAMQQIALASSCSHLLEGLSPKDQQEFIRYFATQFGRVHIKGLTIIRQWNDKGHSYTTIAVPQTSLTENSCQYPDLSSIIAEYLSAGRDTVEGLLFCLSQTPRHSRRERVIRQRLAGLYQLQGISHLGHVVEQDSFGATTSTSLDSLILQNRLERARILVKDAERYTASNDWQQALPLISQALELSPRYAPSFLLLSDYFLRREQPALALAAANKAMRSSTFFQKALEQQVACLMKMNSEEVEVLQYLLALSREGSTGYPAEWEQELELLAEVKIASLVIASGGQAVEGENCSPGPEFNQAVELYGNAKNDDDLHKVLAHLISTVEKEPYSAQTWNLIGACYRNLNRPLMALPFLWQALKLDPDYDLALANLALCCRELGLLRSTRYYIEYEAVKNSANDWVQASYAKFQETSK